VQRNPDEDSGQEEAWHKDLLQSAPMAVKPSLFLASAKSPSSFSSDTSQPKRHADRRTRRNSANHSVRPSMNTRGARFSPLAILARLRAALVRSRDRESASVAT
jgi:hypothetical protein